MKKAFWFCWLILIVACQDDELTKEPYRPTLMEIPKGFDEILIPEDNAFTESRWALGKKLFFDPMLSVDSTISCASCHKPELAFSDDLPTTPGVKNRPGTRNAPTLANVAYHPYFTREGGVPTLEMQILIPFQEHNEFDFNIVLLAERLRQDSTYRQMAETAYNREVDAFVITRALACFERSLISGWSPYDDFIQNDNQAVLSGAAKNGMELFFSGRTNCSTCHGGFNFTNYAFENNGLYENYADPGRFRLTGLESDRALFKVPSLRNIELTAPYMHDGSMATLEEVVAHYQSGGKNYLNKSSLIQPLDLTESEQKDLVEFLKSLTDEVFVENEMFRER